MIPAAILGLIVAGGIVSDPEEPVETADTDAPLTTVFEGEELEATTTTTIDTAPLGSVSERELSDALSQLANADVVVSFEPASDYDRSSYTGSGWPDSDNDCQSDRHEILIEESLSEPVLTDDGCQVATGLWVDPYDGVAYDDARLVTIDHHIPLAAAHRAGAWQWDEQSRRSFASDISFPATHVAVGAEINQSKGDQGPDQWRPPNEDSWCRYAVDWISVKDRWSLAFTEAETDALDEMLGGCATVSSINPLVAGATEVAPTTTAAPTTTTTTTTTSSTTTTTVAPTTTTTTTTLAPTTTVAPTSPPTTSNCHPNYSPCVPNLPGDALNCPQVGFRVTVIGADPYGLDGDNDGEGCESYG